MAQRWKLYGTLGCHLCDQAQAMVAHLQTQFEISLEYIDIAEREIWMKEYGQRIPVLENSKLMQTTDWPFDPEVLTLWLENEAEQ
jgi:hypothetical protein